MGIPREQSEQIALKHWLNSRRLLWIDVGGREFRYPLLWEHIPNGFERTDRGAQAAQNAGASRGSPDVRIYDSPPAFPQYKGVAIELKRVRGERERKAQSDWLEALRKRGWIAFVASGSEEAIRALIGLGY